MNEDTKQEQSSTAGAAKGGVTSEESGVAASIPPSTAPAPQTDERAAFMIVADKAGWYPRESQWMGWKARAALVAAPAPQQSEPKAKDDATAGRAMEIAAVLPNGVAVTNVYEAYEAGLAQAAQAAPSAPAEVDGVRWDLFPGYLIDHHEGDIITEEGLQGWLVSMLKHPDYLAAVAASKAAPSAKAEPVAWALQLKNGALEFGSRYGIFESKELADAAHRSHLGSIAAVPLYTAPAPAVQAEDVRNQAKWISVDEREPEEGQKCIVLIWPYNNRENEQIECIADYIDGTFMNHEGDDMHPPSHWMPFPDVARHAAPSTRQTSEQAEADNRTSSGEGAGNA